MSDGIRLHLSGITLTYDRRSILDDSGLVLHGGRLSPIDWDLRFDRGSEAVVLAHYSPEKRHKRNHDKWKEDSRRVRR